MSEIKFNIFNQIHKGLRTLMFDCGMKVQQTDFTDKKQARNTLDQIDLMLDLFDEHAKHEDICILEVTKKIPSAVLLQFEAEHEKDLELSNKLREQVNSCRSSNETNSYPLGAALLYDLNEFIAFNLVHMNKEESELNALLWKHYSITEIMDIQRNIQAMIAPEKTFIYFKWMIKGLNDPELLHWLKMVHGEAPEFVFKALAQECQHNLPEKRWQKLEVELQD